MGKSSSKPPFVGFHVHFPGRGVLYVDFSPVIPVTGIAFPICHKPCLHMLQTRWKNGRPKTCDQYSNPELVQMMEVQQKLPEKSAGN